MNNFVPWSGKKEKTKAISMLAKTYTAAVNGLETTTVTVEVNVTRGVLFHMTGLPDAAVKESYDPIKAAPANQGF